MLENPDKPIAVKIPTVNARLDGFGEEEWTARVELAALYRAVAHYGMTDLINNHITLRVPSEPGHFLINSYGLMYHEMTASSLFKIDHDAKVICDPENGFDVNPAGFAIHSAIHRARPGINCVIHTHTRAGVAVSAMKTGLLPISQFACVLGDVGYHDFEGPVLDREEGARLVANLGDARVMVLRNHGLLVAAESVSEAFFLIYNLESACKIQVDAMHGEIDGLAIPPRDVVEKTANFAAGFRKAGARQWNAVLRLLSDQESSYAQ
jgi:ribulose-5-phosphate 4-epimerase/fuculose-1-phosphate aldolase